MWDVIQITEGKRGRCLPLRNHENNTLKDILIYAHDVHIDIAATEVNRFPTMCI